MRNSLAPWTWLLVAPSAAAAAPCLTSLDGSLTSCFDAASGQLVSLSVPGAPPFSFTAGGTELESAVRAGAATVRASAGSITVSQQWTFLPPAPPGAGALVVDTFTAAPASVAWDVTVTAPAGAPAWGAPVATRLSVAAATYAQTKVWAPWDRNSGSTFPAKWVDPLQPSDNLPAGWWDGCYVLGSGGTAGGCDLIVAPHVALLSADPAAADGGVTLALSPADLPLDVFLRLQGSDPANASLAFSRSHARIGGAAPPLALHADLIGHAADWRASLAWSAREYAPYWEPVNLEALVSCGGLGSYSYFGDAPADSLEPYMEALVNMSYAVNWDLSGRYFPYMGQFLPPVGADDVWLNDAEGTQPRANTSFASIGAWYRKMANAGFLDLSYFNVNEVSSCARAPKPRSDKLRPHKLSTARPTNAHFDSLSPFKRHANQAVRHQHPAAARLGRRAARGAARRG